MLTLNGVAKLYGDTLVLEDCSFQLRAGERVAMVGPNGAGKTTLLRILAGQLQPDAGTVVYSPGARAAYLPQDAGVAPGRTLHAEMASVFGRIGDIEARQRALESEMGGRPADDPGLMPLVEEHAALHAEFERLDGYAAESKIGRVLAGLGFGEDDWPRPTDEFSGGWQMRIALAKLLLQSPEVLLLDEPTNHLDLDATEWLEEFLVESRTAVVIVSHDRYFLDRVTRRTLELRDGRINDFPMPYSRYAEERVRRDEAQLAAHERQREYLAKQRAYIERFRASPTRHTLVQSREKMLEKIERIERPRRGGRIAFRFAAAQASGREVVKIEGARKAYGQRIVLDGLDLLIERGERIGLVGPNGAGKSTLLRLIARAERADRGHVYHGHNVQTVFYTQTQAESLDPSKTALEEVRDSAPNGMTEQELRDLLGRFLLQGEDVDRAVGVLSGGERSRLALAKLLLRPANLLLLDEPTNHLDITSREVLESALRAYPGTAIIASHDRYLLDRVTTRILEVGDRKVASFLGNYTRYRERKATLAATNRALETPSAARSGAAAPTAADARPGAGGSAPAEPARPPAVKGRAEGGGARAPTERDRERAAKQAASRMSRIETELERLQADRRRLETRLADPTLWSDQAEAARIVDELTRVQAEIDRMSADWEELIGST
ncbi:MAG TPA: ABC-F family ATP-binding cassette domain-containing protein [Chloroflexota bacterium]|jgi:ATP-binding cassette subfamily F protein 3